MLRKVLYSKIHGARVTGAAPDYTGSITLDAHLLEQAGLRVGDAVLVANCRNAERFETYVLRGEPGSGAVVVNGAAAHLVEIGDKLLILHFALLDADEYRQHRPKVLVLRDDNSVERVLRYEPA